jgi:hypothetical protein
MLVSRVALADICSTNAEGCAGTWEVTNTTAENTCYTLFLGSSTKNFCLTPGESASESVRYGDTYCVAQLYTPNPNTCNRQYFTVRL